MRVVYRGSDAGARKDDGQNLQTVDRNVQAPAPQRVTHINGQRIYFRDLARMAFPNKTEAHLAFIARVDVRTARRWLAPDDKNEPPADVLGVVLAEIMTRFHQRD